MIAKNTTRTITLHNIFLVKLTSIRLKITPTLITKMDLMATWQWVIIYRCKATNYLVDNLGKLILRLSQFIQL